jgi:hypothetical protein
MLVVLFALALSHQPSDPAADMPSLLEPATTQPTTAAPPTPPPTAGSPVAEPKKKKAPLPDKTADDIAWAAGAGGVATGLCSACACGWLPFFGVPMVGLATAAGAVGGAMYGAKDKPGWGTAILVDAAIAGGGGLIGAGIGTALMAAAVVSSSQAPFAPPGGQPLVLAAIGGAVLLSAAGAVGGALGGAYAVGSFPPDESDKPAVRGAAPPQRTSTPR